jgi:hypothetical protein
MPRVGFPTNKKIPGFPVLPPVRSWIDQEVRAGGFRQQANNRANHLLIWPGIVVLSMLQIRCIRPEWLIGCGFWGGARTIPDERGRKCPVSGQYKI